ncbi:SDR family NAD(P)-dependent oxidoreductase [Flavobacterium sp.]|uniref:SDR family NAD(P)-dependent oxidoreductase n=1 Tax=Flavobacterium sp. TaxID=239 RepID=UPI0026247C32|nr:SDR family NAD(P)-dependent oxidoreductase [Flavobacterium sp.]
MKKVLIILGMGPGLSLGIAEKFGAEGFTIGMISRNRHNLTKYRDQLAQKGITAHFKEADLANTEQMITALKELSNELGQVDVLAYNAVDYRMKHILEETIEDLTNGFKISVGNVLVAVQEVLPFLQKSKGAILLTGGASAHTPDPNMGSISLGKAGIKNLAFQLHTVLKSKQVFVGTVTIAGWINPESQTHSPKQIAEQFWKLYHERDRVEIAY